MAVAKKPKKPCRNIYEALTLMVLALYVFCYVRFYKKGDRFRSTASMYIYSLSVPVLISMGLVWGTFSIRTSPKYIKYFQEMDTVLMFVVLMDITVAVMSFLFNAINMQGRSRRHLHIYEHLERIDVQLMEEFKAKMCYEKIAFKISIIFWVFLVYGVTINSAVISSWSQGDLFKMYIITFCHTFIIFGMHMIVFSFMTVADLLRIRFRLLQKLLAPAYLRRHYVDQDVRMSKLRKAVQIYRELYEVIDEVNSVHGVCLVSCLAHDFTLGTSLLYLMFGRSSNLTVAGDLHLFFGVFLLLLPPAYKMVMTPVYGMMSWKEGAKCMRIIKLMDDAFPGNSQVRQIVASTLLWNNHNKYREYKIGPTITSNISLITAENQIKKFLTAKK
ncbi:putative gustatory receptor 57a [Eupeodes corollae]|uniref:putative gustatory receptor 57a n=1 Tax=Eupeodes corollae TaxID=290404 RepID=UPI002491C6B2|nr:putative gustatory receptor 57a [Eupeodes corollae]